MSVGLDEAMKSAQKLGGLWRAPSGPELESIIDRSCGSPVVDVSVFPDIQKDEDGEADYWTTNSVGMADLYYFFDFMSGQADGHTRGFQLPCGSLAIKNNPERRLARRRLAADDGVLSFCCGGDAQQRGVSHLCAKACAGLVLAQAVSLTVAQCPLYLRKRTLQLSR
jgi:hypothetical protein